MAFPACSAFFFGLTFTMRFLDSEVVQREFSRMADLWEQALPRFREAMRAVPISRRRQADGDLAIAETCYLHFRSTANQVAFYILRDGPRTPEALQRMRAIAKAEIELARRLYPLARLQSLLLPAR